MKTATSGGQSGTRMHLGLPQHFSPRGCIPPAWLLTGKTTQHRLQNLPSPTQTTKAHTVGLSAFSGKGMDWLSQDDLVKNQKARCLQTRTEYHLLQESVIHAQVQDDNWRSWYLGRWTNNICLQAIFFRLNGSINSVRLGISWYHSSGFLMIPKPTWRTVFLWFVFHFFFHHVRVAPTPWAKHLRFNTPITCKTTNFALISNICKFQELLQVSTGRISSPSPSSCSASCDSWAGFLVPSSCS